MPKAVDMSEFDAADKESPQTRCSIRRALDTLPPERAASLTTALADPKYTHTVIARTVAGWGIRLTANPISRHRRHECTCD